MRALKELLQLVIIASYLVLAIIGACIGYVGITFLLSPNYPMVIESHLFGLLALSYLFYALLIVYNKSRVIVGVVRVIKNE